MATDLRVISGEILAFHDFTGEVVLHVGAGGGQLIDEGAIAMLPAVRKRRVLAVCA